MSGILWFENSAHRQAERLLPWYVNDTLEGVELEQFRRHLAECVRCQREAVEQRELLRSCVDAGARVDVPPSFERMRRRIGLPEPARVPEEIAPSPGRAAAIRRGWAGTAPWLRWAAAGQLAAIMVLGGMLFGDKRPAPVYRTLGDPETVVPAADVRHLIVVFDPQLSEAQMRVLLRASRARIIDGPSETGTYVLALPVERAASVQEALRAAPGVLMVQSLDPGERR